MKSPLNVTIWRPLHDISAPSRREATDSCSCLRVRPRRTRKGTRVPTSPVVDRVQSLSFVGCWLLEWYMWCMSQSVGYGLDQVAGHVQWKQTIFPSRYTFSGASRWPAQKTAYSYNTNHAGHPTWAFQELWTEESCWR